MYNNRQGATYLGSSHGDGEIPRTIDEEAKENGTMKGGTIWRALQKTDATLILLCSHAIGKHREGGKGKVKGDGGWGQNWQRIGMSSRWSAVVYSVYFTIVVA